MATDWTHAFELERPHLFGVAYRMLGSAAEAEDVVQEAWIRARESGDTPKSPRAFLTTIVVRLSLDALKSARARRESYVGPWLPEPLLTSQALEDAPPDDRIGTRESISMALLLILETLTPLERATFLLREVFEYDFAEIALVLARNEPAIRQLFHRAREHVRAARPRFEADEATQRRIIATFLQATSTGDAAALEALLAEDVIATSDGGGRVTAALKPIHGPARVAALFIGLAKKAAGDVAISIEPINVQLGVTVRIDGRLAVVVVPDIEKGRIRRLYTILNPDKLARFAETL